MPLLPPIRAMPDDDLLHLLLGDAAVPLAHRPLADLFALWVSASTFRESVPRYGALRTLDAAKELMTRDLSETLQAGDCLADPGAVKDLLRLRLSHLPHEVFVVLLLDAQHRLIDCVELFRGTLTQTSVYPREVVKLALERHAAGVVFAHNHPSGVAEPSSADEELTRSLKAALALVDVRVLDHFIVAGSAVPVSFAERGLI